MNDAKDFAVEHAKIEDIKARLKFALNEMDVHGVDETTILLRISRETATATLHQIEEAAAPIVEDFWNEVSGSQPIQ